MLSEFWSGFIVGIAAMGIAMTIIDILRGN